MYNFFVVQNLQKDMYNLFFLFAKSFCAKSAKRNVQFFFSFLQFFFGAKSAKRDVIFFFFLQSLFVQSLQKEMYTFFALDIGMSPVTVMRGMGWLRLVVSLKL